jgi:hypothetical protein
MPGRSHDGWIGGRATVGWYPEGQQVLVTFAKASCRGGPRSCLPGSQSGQLQALALRRGGGRSSSISEKETSCDEVGHVILRSDGHECDCSDTGTQRYRRSGPAVTLRTTLPMNFEHKE